MNTLLVNCTLGLTEETFHVLCLLLDSYLPGVTSQSFVPYTSDDLTGTPQNNSMPTRLLRTRIDVGLIRSDVTALRAQVTALQNAASSNANNGAATIPPALNTRLDTIEATLASILAGISNVTGPPNVSAGQGFVFSTPQDFPISELSRLIPAGIVVQSTIQNPSATHTIEALRVPIEEWRNSTDIGDGRFVLNNVNYHFLAQPIPFGPTGLIFAIGTSGATLLALYSEPGDRIQRATYPWNGVMSAGGLGQNLPPIPLRSLQNRSDSSIDGPLPQSGRPVNLTNIQNMLHAVRLMTRSMAPHLDTVPQGYIPGEEIVKGYELYQSVVKCDLDDRLTHRPTIPIETLSVLPKPIETNGYSGPYKIHAIGTENVGEGRIHFLVQRANSWQIIQVRQQVVHSVPVSNVRMECESTPVGRTVMGSPQFPQTPVSQSKRTPSNLIGVASSMDTLLRYMEEISPYFEVAPQATVKGDDLKIADVEQLTEAPNNRHINALPADTEKDVLDSWNIQKILSRPALLSRFVWGTQTFGDELASASFPNRWLANEETNRHFSTLLNSFNMVKMNVVFRLMVNTTPMYGGVLAMYFDFFDRVRGFTDNPPQATSVSNCDPVYLDLSSGSTAELSLPFSAVSQYLTRTSDFATQFLGSVRVVAMSNLSKPPAAPDVEVRVYAYLEGVDVAVLAEPETRPFVVPQASVVRTITSFAHSFLPGMRDPYPLALEDSYKLTRSNTCRVEDVCGVFGLIGTMDWNTGDPFNVQKASIPVHPMQPFMRFENDAEGVVPVTPNGPKLMHIGRHYSYWNGSIEYKIQVACSNVHAGKLLVVFVPGSNPTQAQRTAVASNPHLLLDVKERHEISFTVPFISPTAWKPTYLNGFFGDIGRLCTGRIVIRSADPIKSPFEDSTTVTINVYARATKDFQFSVPRNGLNTINRPGAVISQEAFLTSVRPNIRMNSEDFNDLYKIMRRYVSIGNGVNVTRRTGERNPDSVVIPVRPMKLNTAAPNSIGHICRGFSFWRGSLKYKIKIIGNAASFEVMHIPTYGVPRDMLDFHVLRPTTFDAGQTGSLGGSQLFEGGIDKEWEVVVPYYSMYDWLHLPTRDFLDVNAKLPLLSTNNGCLIIRPLFRDADYSLTVSMSVGEDFELAGPSTYPAITFPENISAMETLEVVPQGMVEYPKFAKNPLFREAWDSLPAESLARSSRTQFNKHFYTFCKECECNVFGYKHAERCNPSGSGPIPEVVEIQGLTDFFNKLSSTNDIINTIVNNWKAETPESMSEKLVEVVRSSVKALLADAKIAVRDWFSKILESVDWKLFVSAMVTGCAVFALREIIDSPIAQLALASISMLVSHKFVSFVAELLKKEQCHIRVQNGSGFQMSHLIQLCCGVMVYFLNLASSNSASKIIKGLGDLGRSLSGIKAGTDALSVFSTWMEEKLVPELSPTDGNVLRGMMANSLDILTEVSELNLEEMKVRCLTELEIQQRVLKTYDECHKLVKLAIANNAPNSIQQALARSMTKMEKLRSEVVAYKGNDPYRIDPFHVSIFGEPGCGKSACMAQIIEDFRVMEDWPQTNLQYARTVDTEYWDGYNGQTAVVYDDLAQVVQDGPCDITELIGLKSNSPYMVHMASIQDKGRYFTSKFIISSTNVKLLPNYGGLRKPAAFHRRRNVLLEMRKRTVNGVPVPFMEDTEEARVRHAEFRILNSLTGEAEQDVWFNYEQVMEIVLNRGKIYYDEQRELLRRSVEQKRPSTVAQALIADRREQTIPVVVDTRGEMHFVDAEAQGLFESSSDDEKKWYRKAWSSAYQAAWERRDFGMMVSGFSPVSRLNIINAINTFDYSSLNPTEMLIYQKFQAYDKLKAICDKRSAEISVLASRVSSYFGDLWDQYKPSDKKHLATGLAGMGVIAIALSMAYRYTKKDSIDRETNEIPVNAFAEAVPLEYRSKDRRENSYVVEGAQEGKEWLQRNPGMIPCRYELVPGKGWFKLPTLGPETTEWKDYVEYCNSTGQDPFNWRGATVVPESGIDDFKTKRQAPKKIVVESGIDDHKTKRQGPKRIVLESGIDDHKTRRQGPKRIVVEGMFGTSPMATDVPVEILNLSEEELLAEMSATQVKGEHKVIDTGIERYHVELPVDPQATSDNVAATLIDNGLLDNLALIYHPKSTLRMRAIMLEDKFIAVPKHFFLSSQANFQQDDTFIFRVREKVYEQRFDRKSLFILPKRDLAVYLLSARVTGARSIVNKIATAEEHAKFKECTGSLLGLACNDKGDIWVKQRGLPSIHGMLEGDHLRVQYPIGSETHVLKGYRYYADTVNGECGSLLIQNNKYIAGKIIGFHVAASLGKQLAFSELLVRSELEMAMRVLTAETGYISGGTSIAVYDKLVAAGIAVQGGISPAFNQLHDHIDIAAALAPELVKRNPGKTEIRPSLLQGVIDIERKTEPAILTHKDPRCPKGYDPMVGAVNKFSKPAKPFKPEHLRLVQDHMVQKYRQYSGFIGKRLLSLSEAINGIPSVEYADAINMKSAEGAFWNSERPIMAHNKEWMFKSEEVEGRKVYSISHKPLLAKILHRIKEAQEGRRVMSVTQECLKDERRGLNKIYCDEPGTRVFTIMPVDYTIVFRQYFWDFSAMLMKNRNELGPQIGINPLSIEWTTLMCRLKAKSSKGFAGDYKNYDSQEMAELMDNACSIINRWYDDGPVNASVRKVLFQEGYDRYSTCYDAILHIDQGLPSGFPATALVNSMNNDQYRYLSWLELAPPEMKSLSKCDEETDRISYGDDHVDAVTDKALPFYNQQTFGKFLEDYGIIYTDAHKNSWKTAQEWEPVEQTSFLKRLFHAHPDYKRFYLAPLEKKSIEDRLLWITDSKFASEQELLAENIKNSLMDAFHWGPLYYNELYEKIDVALRAIGQEKLMTPISYSSLEYEWLSSVPGMGESHVPLVRDVFGL